MQSDANRVDLQEPGWPRDRIEERLKCLKVRMGVVRKNRVYFDSADYYKTVWYNKLHAVGTATEDDVHENLS